MNLDVWYSPEHDRLRLSVRTQTERVDWWLTRRLLLAWMAAWLRQLDAVDLPTVAGVNLRRDLGEEHRLSLEFDAAAPAARNQKAVNAVAEWLLQTVELTVAPTGCVLVLKTSGLQQTMELTRKESHAVLDMLFTTSRAAGWFECPQWPQWLG